MDPITIGTAIKAGASVIGGLLGRNKAPSAGDTVRQTMAGIAGQARGAREAGEAYGFNPLTLLGVSSPIAAQGVDNSMFGQSIAESGLAIADGIDAQSAQKAYLAKLEEQNADLRKALDHQTLRPKVGGIFPTTGPAAAAAASGVGSSVPPLGPFDLPVVVRGPLPDRPEQINPLQNEPWFKKVNVFGKDLVGWNDEAAESEIMSTLVSLSFPMQYMTRSVFDDALMPGKGYLRDRPGGKNIFSQIYEDLTRNPVPSEHSKAGYLLSRP